MIVSLRTGLNKVVLSSSDSFSPRGVPQGASATKQLRAGYNAFWVAVPLGVRRQGGGVEESRGSPRKERREHVVRWQNGRDQE